MILSYLDFRFSHAGRTFFPSALDINFLLISIQFNLTLLVGYTNVAIFKLVKCESVYGYVSFVELMVFLYVYIVQIA